MPYYNDRHTVQWWTPGMFQLYKEKRVVLKCHSYHFKREICSVKLSWLHCLLLLFFLFPQLTACVVLKLQLQLLVLNGWEHKHICVHTYGGKTGKHKDVIRIANHSWQLVDVHGWWFQVTDTKSDLVWKLYRHPEQSQAVLAVPLSQP